MSLDTGHLLNPSSLIDRYVVTLNEVRWLGSAYCSGGSATKPSVVQNLEKFVGSEDLSDRLLGVTTCVIYSKTMRWSKATGRAGKHMID